MKDISQFEQLYRTRYIQLYAFARQFVADEEECHDVVDMAFEGLWKHFKEIKEDTVLPYLYQTTRNICINYLRKKKLKTQYIKLKTLVTEEAATDSLAEYEERMEVAYQVLSELGEPTESIMKACFIEGKKYKEVAKEMNISLSLVKKHVVKALRLIREKKLKIKDS